MFFLIGLVHIYSTLLERSSNELHWKNQYTTLGRVIKIEVERYDSNTISLDPIILYHIESLQFVEIVTGCLSAPKIQRFIKPRYLHLTKAVCVMLYYMGRAG